jgi:hypothetical protein
LEIGLPPEYIGYASKPFKTLVLMGFSVASKFVSLPIFSVHIAAQIYIFVGYHTINNIRHRKILDIEKLHFNIY